MRPEQGPPVALSTASVYPEPVAAGFELAAELGYDAVELMVWGDRVSQDVAAVGKLAERMKSWQPPPPPLASGYWKLYVDHVLQADRGADLDFLVGKRGAFVPRDNH